MARPRSSSGASRLGALALAMFLPVVAPPPGVAARARPSPRAALPGHLAPPGYTIDSLDAVTPRPTWREAKDGSFTYSIRREFSDSTLGRMLGIAEAVYPPRDALVEIAARRYYEMGSDTAGAALWWCRGIGVRRIPYAVTAGAMEHFLGLTERFRDHLFWETGTGGGLFWTDFIYHATIAARDTFYYQSTVYTQVYVAQIRFAWSYDDGTFVPVTETQRTVVLSARGDVLAVEGDGRADEQVGMSDHRGIGHVDNIMR